MSDQSKKIKDELGAHLKHAYEDTLNEGVPEVFRALIDENLKRGVSDTLDEGIPERFIDLLSKLGDAKRAEETR